MSEIILLLFWFLETRPDNACRVGWSGTCYIDQAGFEPNSLCLELKAQATTPGLRLLLYLMDSKKGNQAISMMNHFKY